MTTVLVISLDNLLQVTNDFKCIYEKEVDQLSTSFLPIFEKFFSTLRKL